MEGTYSLSPPKAASRVYIASEVPEIFLNWRHEQIAHSPY